MSESIVNLPIERVESLLLLIRGEKVIMDRELARLYGFSTKVLDQAVRHDLNRFLGDFMFQLTTNEAREPGGRNPGMLV